jgi:uncharacterized protein
MEKGNLLRLQGRYGEAEQYLLEADRISDMQTGTGVGEQAASMLTSDLALDFRGADYEKVFINYCLACCYAASGNLEDALVECRRVNEKLEVLNQQYENSNRYRDDAFVRYLMGVLFEASGDRDDALVAYRNSLAAYETDYAAFYGLGAPGRLSTDLLRMTEGYGFEDLHAEFAVRWPGVQWEGTGPGDGRGELVVICEEGLIPPRYESSVEGWSDDRVFRIAVPAIPEVRRVPSRVAVRCGAWSTEGFLAEDLSAIAVKNLEDQAARDLARAIARAAVKALAAEAAEETMEEVTGDENGCLSEGTGLLVSILGSATENADLRSWLTLPGRIYVARLALPPGQQPVEVFLDGRRVASRPVEVVENGISLLFVSSATGK